ncbi:zinc finger protein 160-like isoform X5 [Vanessa cardui]|uniref:zinc finger protein 160-like isoform X5 n=1 Tax=Vanessa cardui TaxID=171605 RepID=UPI001F132EEB|nr:zinc finger protein 160-like isoform X5 [Vanessa cardui]
MEFDEIVVKESPGLCRCCLSEGCYKDLGTEYTWMDETEVYADMLFECFDISISQHMEGPNGPNRLICEVCITRLRDACNFKKQVLHSEKKFVDMVGRGDFKSKVIVYQEQMKSEMVMEPQPAHDADVEYLDEDIDYDDGNKDDSNEPTVSEDITVDALPIKGKRGRPKKTTVKPEKKKSKLEEKTKPKIVKDCKMQSDECSTGLTAMQRQNLHKLFSITSIIPFKCNDGLACLFCGKRIPQYEDFRKHTKSHEMSTIKSFLNEYKSNFVNIDVSETVCEACDLPFDYDNLIDHLITFHEFKNGNSSYVNKFDLVDFKCFECVKSYSMFSYLEHHIQKNHNSCYSLKLLNDNESYIIEKVGAKTNSKLKHNLNCPKCLKMLTSKLGFKIHLTKCGIKKESTSVKSKDSNTFKIRHNIASIINMSTAVPFKFFKNKFRCFFCSKDFTDFDNLRDHAITDHPHFNQECKAMKMIKGRDVNVKIDISNLTCKLCFENSLALNDLINHLISKHGVNYDKSIECLQPFRVVKDNMPCPICPNMVFRYFKKLLEHMNEFHSDNNIVCAHCGLTFRGHPNYRAHMSRYHRKKACKCPDCNMEFWNLEKLARHRANVHGTKKYKCPQCIEKFITQHLMRKHQILVHGFGHKCPYCGKMFTRNSHMKNHVRRLHLKEKNVECTVCKEKFFDRALLNVHMVKHVGERNYHCDVCGKKFLWKKNLRGHMASHERNS